MEVNNSEQRVPLSIKIHKDYTLQSIIIGNWLRETAPVGRAKPRRKIRVPICNNYAPISILTSTLNLTDIYKKILDRAE